MRGLLMREKPRLVVIDLVEDEAIRIVVPTQDVEAHVARFVPSTSGVYLRRGDERRDVFGFDVHIHDYDVHAPSVALLTAGPPRQKENGEN